MHTECKLIIVQFQRLSNPHPNWKLSGWGWGVVSKPKIFKESTKLNWDFQRDEEDRFGNLLELCTVPVPDFIKFFLIHLVA